MRRTIERGMVLGALLLAACGSDADSKAGEGTTSGTQGDPPETTTGSGGASTASLGSIVLASDEAAKAFTVRATLRKVTGTGEQDCTTTPKGPACEVKVCSGSMGTPPPYRYVHAGALTVGGLSAPLVLEAGEASYAFVGSRELRYVDGNTISFDAPGKAGDVPAFSSTLDTPPVVVVAAPKDAAGKVDVDRAKDFTLTWDPSRNGLVVATITVNKFEEGTTVTCWAPTSAGSLTMPTDVLAALFPTGGSGRGEITASIDTFALHSRTVTVTVTAGTDSIELRAERRATAPHTSVVVR